MSYQSTVELIRDAANTVNLTGRFIHGRKIDASQKYDGMYPLIVLYPFQIRKGIDPDFIDSSDLLLGFLDQDRPDTSPEEREELVTRMDELSEAFIEHLSNNSQVRMTGMIKEPLYQFYSGTMSGFAIRFTFQDYTPCEEEL